MKIAYISIDDPRNHISWSGLKLNIYNILKKLNHDVKIIGPLRDYNRIPFIIQREAYKLFNQKYESERKIYLSKIYAKKIYDNLKLEKFDLIFTSDTYLLSYLNTKTPIILWTDVTFKTYYSHYFNKFKINQKSFLEANNLEKLSLKKINKIILTSKWSKNETIKNYKINKNKIEIIPFGSNINENRKVIIKNKKNDILKLITVGVDWDRKGVDKSIQVVKFLNDNGCKSELTIIGSTRKKNFPKFIKQIGFLNKNIPTDNQRIKNYFKNSDLHILMTKSEACGVVFAEANSYGLYNITHDVGGVSGMIRNNHNGKLFKINDSYKKIGNYIIELNNDKKKFLDLRKKSLEFYISNLSWKNNSIKLNKLFEYVLKNDS